jgi:hypothetical protein
MFHKLLISLFFLVNFHFCVTAQIDKKDSIPETKEEKKQEKRKYNLRQFGRESYLFIKQPIDWKAHMWVKVGVVVAATILVMPFDERVTNSKQPEKPYFYSVPIVAGRIYGEWYSIGGVAASFGLFGLFAQNDPAKKITIELMQGGIYAEAITTILKVAIGRARPYYNQSATTFHLFTFGNDDFHSMPSGHTTSAMALSTVMSRHAKTIGFKILAYLPAAFTMVSRIYQDKHWMSDVIPAAAIGYFAGNWVVDLHEGRRHRINVTSAYPLSISVNLN